MNKEEWLSHLFKSRLNYKRFSACVDLSQFSGDEYEILYSLKEIHHCLNTVWDFVDSLLASKYKEIYKKAINEYRESIK